MKRKSYKMEGSVMMDYVNAFWIGGLICALVQILLEKQNYFRGVSWCFLSAQERY